MQTSELKTSKNYYFIFTISLTGAFLKEEDCTLFLAKNSSGSETFLLANPYE